MPLVVVYVIPFPTSNIVGGLGWFSPGRLWLCLLRLSGGGGAGVDGAELRILATILVPDDDAGVALVAAADALDDLIL